MSRTGKSKYVRLWKLETRWHENTRINRCHLRHFWLKGGDIRNFQEGGGGGGAFPWKGSKTSPLPSLKDTRHKCVRNCLESPWQHARDIFEDIWEEFIPSLINETERESALPSKSTHLSTLPACVEHSRTFIKGHSGWRTPYKLPLYKGHTLRYQK